MEVFKTRFAYEYAARLSAIIYGDHDDIPRNILLDFFSDIEKMAKPDKKTLLHEFIFDVTYLDYEHYTGKAPDPAHYKAVLEEANIKCPKWMNEKQYSGHDGETDVLLNKAVKKLTPTVFQILFSDRTFLFSFQKEISRKIKTLKKKDYPDLLKFDGVFKRPQNIPSWLRSAIYYRDKGRCQLCWRDITGLVSPSRPREIQLDHMIPLAQSGSNDPTNFQLTCGQCNQGKSAKVHVEPARLVPYWE